MKQLNAFTMIEFDQMKEEACMSFISPNNGELRKLWIHRDTLQKLIGVKRWDKNAYGEPTLLQDELKKLLLREFPSKDAVVQWFETTANDIQKSKAQGTR